MEQVISQLMQAAFTTDEESWFSQLKITHATDTHMEQFCSVTEAIN